MGMKFSILLALFLMIGPRLGWADSPTEMTQQLIASIQACQGKNPSVSQNDNCNVQKIEGHLAIAELARWLLGPHWEEIGTEKQASFTALLASLLREIAYPRAAEFLANTRVDYGDGLIDGNEAIVETSVVKSEEGQVSIDYRLHQIDGRWQVWDVRLDGVSMAGNLRKQVQSVIARHSYDELVRRMQQKLEESKPD